MKEQPCLSADTAGKNYLMMFRHGSRSFSLHIVCSSEVFAANHHRGDLFGAQCRYEPSPNILIMYLGNTSQKVELEKML
jgi:hypothetical protein